MTKAGKNPKPTPLTYEILTAIITGAADAARRMEMRAGINRLCERCRRKK